MTYLTVDEAAELLRVSRRTILRMVDAGKIPSALKVGAQYRIPSTFVDEMKMSVAAK